MFGLFKKKVEENPSVAPILVDVHSHFLPGIDDGVQSFEEALDILRAFSAMGYKKVITTPHIYWDYYPNTPEIILKKLHVLREKIAETDIDIKISAAAEYFLDDHLISLVENKGKLLTFGENYLLFETSFINQPAYLVDTLFKIFALGLTPVMAHPERYLYMHNNIQLAEDLVDRGVLLQVNINSLTGHYSKEVKKCAEKLIDKNLVSFLGSDCHNMRHVGVLKRSAQTKYFKKLANQPILNNTL